MKIALNGIEREVAPATSIEQLLQDAGYGGKRVAVEINREIVPRSRHAEHRLAADDRVEIVHAIGGG
ncbi:sulfur carrier protein ThiS [Dokdonella sp.]|uniref:sulfur carrier protein ThiS n=1 Tax=Dokdonella sp. TaxID=2291710 RepID=UPI002624AF59|nr:sulfur carrier protein ThiS [Dokdonella sp.]